MPRATLCLLLLAPALAGCFGAPAPAPDVHAAIMAHARGLADALDTPEEALAAGYVPDPFCIPGQGVHWVNPALLDNVLDPAAPEILLFLPDTADLADTAGDRFMGLEYYVVGEELNQSVPELLGRRLAGPMPGHFLEHAWHADLHVYLATGFESNASFPGRIPGIVCPPATEPVPRHLAYEACDEQVGVFPVAPDAFPLPEGFAHTPYAGSPAPSGTLLVAAYACERAHGSRFSPELLREETWDAGAVRENFGALLVVPPQHLHAGHDFHLIPLGWFTTSPDVAASYQAWAIPALAAEVVYEVLQDTPVARAGRSQAGDGNFTATLSTAVRGPAVPDVEGGARLFGVNGTVVQHMVDVAWPAAPSRMEGPATLQLQGQGAPSPFPPPLAPGLGAHIWGEGYGYAVAWSRLPAAAPAPAGNATLAPGAGTAPAHGA